MMVDNSWSDRLATVPVIAGPSSPPPPWAPWQRAHRLSKTRRPESGVWAERQILKKTI